MSARVRDLAPGMTFRPRFPLQPGATAPPVGVVTFVGAMPHPYYPGLALVIWKMPSPSPLGEWSHDALAWDQDVTQLGEPIESTEESRREALRVALLG